MPGSHTIDSDLLYSNCQHLERNRFNPLDCLDCGLQLCGSECTARVALYKDFIDGREHDNCKDPSL